MDPYLTLGLEYSPDLSDLQIRTAYRKKALVLHPDRNKAPDAKTKFDEVKQASVILLDPKLRKQYDAIYIAKAETSKRMKEASADRQAFLRDLERRQKDFEESLKQHKASDCAEEDLDELEQIIREARQKQKLEQTVTEAKKTLDNTFKLLVNFATPTTSSLVWSTFRDFCPLAVLHLREAEFLVTFKFRDTMLKALKTVKQCEMSLYNPHTHYKVSVMDKLKKKVGVLGKRWIAFEARYENMPSLESLEREVN